MIENFEVKLNPRFRKQYISELLTLDGVRDVQEDRNAAYCPISLTSTPTELKPVVQERQELLMETLESVGITAYDPQTAPYSPDRNLTSKPYEVYAVDSGKIVGARYFTGFNLLPSTGFGVELEKASRFNRMAVVLMDEKIRVSRMLPPRVIYLQYRDFRAQASEFAEVYKYLKMFEPGSGLNKGVPRLLGFSNQDGEVIDLEEGVYENFPQLKYQYDGRAPILDLHCTNPELLDRGLMLASG